MDDSGSSVSVAILTLLTFISIALAGYLTLYCYTHFKTKRNQSKIELPDGHWLEQERKPLIPGNFHAETIQPIVTHDDDEFDEIDSIDGDIDLNFKERDYSKLGRIIFVMRYNRKREELMVRLVQIEGMPVSQDLYSPNSAYVDVQLKYTGSVEEDTELRPPRLDICLQQVYYFIISTQQMSSHSLEFHVNTFDDEYRRYVSGIVEVNLKEELGDDILTGSEVVFVKEILEPFKISPNDNCVDDVDEEYDFVSTASAPTSDKIPKNFFTEEEFRATSPASSNMSWEPESKELLTLSTNSLFIRYSSEMDLLGLSPITDYKRSHSIGYLPTHEWTIKDIPIDDDSTVPTREITSPTKTETALHEAYTVDDANQIINPPPESFYHIVPVTPLYPKDHSKIEQDTSVRRVAYKKHPKRKQLGRSLTINRRTAPKTFPRTFHSKSLDRSSSWPSLVSPEMGSNHEITPERQSGHFFGSDGN